MDNSTLPRFADVLQEHVRRLQESLADLCRSIHADLSVPYPLSKRLGVDKNLTWKAARILQADSAHDAIRHLPGRNGRDLLMDACRRAGAPGSLIKAFEYAVDALQQTVELHTDDKKTLELVLDGIPDQEGNQLATSRRLAFRGNSGIWGVQARTRLTTTLLAPSTKPDGSPDSDAIDLVLVAGFQRFRHLREDTPWPVLRLRTLNEEGQAVAPSPGDPIDPDGAIEGGTSVLTQFSSTPLPKVRAIPTGNSLVFELESGSIGNPGAVDLVFGERRRAFASRWASTKGALAEHQTDIDVPAEFLLFDLLVHKDLPLAKDIEFHLLGRLGRERFGAHKSHRDRALPVQAEVQSLEPTPQGLATATYPRYSELLTYVAGQCGWHLANFRVQRLCLEYPPIPTTAVLSYDLPQQRQPK